MNLIQHNLTKWAEEGPFQEQHPSDRNIQVQEEREEYIGEFEHSETLGIEKRKRLKWPKSSETATWTTFKSTVDAILDIVLTGNVDRELKVMFTLIYKIRWNKKPKGR